MLKTRSNLFKLLALLLVSCNSINEDSIKLIKHEYGGLSFSTTQDWILYKEEQNFVVFSKKTEKESEYQPNFSILLFKEDSNTLSLSIDDIVLENMKQLNDVYAKYKVISYDTILIESYPGRKVSFGALTTQKEKIGCLLYILRNNNDELLIASFQGPNDDGSFKSLVPELEIIARTIEF